MDELVLLASITEDGDISVQMPRDVDIDKLVAAIIRTATERGLDMSRVFRFVQKFRTGTVRTVPEPMVIQ